MAKVDYVKINNTIKYIQNIAYLSELPTANADSADFVSINNVLYAKQVNNGVYSYAEIGGGGGATIIEKETTINEETSMPNFDTLTFTSEELTKMQEDNVVLKISIPDVYSVMFFNKTQNYGFEPYLYYSFSLIIGAQEILLMVVDNEGTSTVRTTITALGGGVEIINADLSWMTSQTTGVIPSQYRDIERLKKAIIVVPDEQVGTFAFRYSFSTGDYYYFTFLTSVDNRPNAIDYHIVLIDISNWEFSIGSGKFNNTKANFVLDGTETELKSIMVGDDYYKVPSAPQVVEITNVPNTATSGTLTQDQIEILQASNQNYIIFNNELFRLNDKQHNEGYLVYSHNGHDTTGCFFQKCITITLSTRGWVLEEQENASKTYVDNAIGTALQGEY